MSGSSDPGRSSFAFTNRADLPGNHDLPERLSRPAPAFEQVRNGPAVSAARPSKMVAKDQPRPVPRPSPAMALETDRAAFNGAWAQEGHEARRAAFKEARRQEASQGRQRGVQRQLGRTGR